jgi:hypothetical protein
VACRLWRVCMFILIFSPLTHSVRSYYQCEMGCMSTCPVTLHDLIHLHTDPCHAGPLSQIWEYVLKDSWGKLHNVSRANIFHSLNSLIQSSRRSRWRLLCSNMVLRRNSTFSTLGVTGHPSAIKR